MNLHFILAWLCLALLFVKIELANSALFLFLPFCFGSLIGAGTAFMDYSLEWQIVTFSIASLLALGFTTLWLVRKETYTSYRDFRSNTDALVGKPAFVVEVIASQKRGRVKIGGEEWLAAAVDEHDIEVGREVEVVQVRGSHVVVRRRS